MPRACRSGLQRVSRAEASAVELAARGLGLSVSSLCPSFDRPPRVPTGRPRL